MNINILMYTFFHISFYLMTWKAIDYKISLSKFNYLSGYKRKYVIKNLVKCFCLSIWSPVALFVIKDAIFNNKWDNSQLHIVGSFYSINDLLGLILVRGLPLATKLHHICVVILGIVNILTDYTEVSVWRACIIYGAFSILSFSVNGYMGLRYITENDAISQLRLCRVALISLIIYLCCFILNWIYHYNLLFTLENNLCSFIYFTMAHLVMYDDIKLIKHLYEKSLYLLKVGNAENGLASTKSSTE